MNTISELMTHIHRHCDNQFAEAENAVNQQNWPLATEQWQLFCESLEKHLNAEEQVLFPAFETATGMTQGPTQVMRMEHEQMRNLVADMNNALSSQQQNSFLGLAETLMVLMQQHNMKEEMMLYPMSDQHLAEQNMPEQLTQAQSKLV